MDLETLASRLPALARARGFDAAGVAPVTLPEERPRLRAWLAAGHAGGMGWLERDEEVRLDLRRRFPWARSVIVVAKGHRPDPREPAGGLAHHVAAYARGRDYHDELTPSLRALGDDLAEEWGHPVQCHAYVDTGPTLERPLARQAGLGWLGKHGLLMSVRGGSWFFLGLLLTDLELSPTGPARGSCGSCRACQPACPTDAFVQPGVLDARRCISYLTIEHRGPIDRALREGMGGWLFGCDLCQTACPFNHRVPPAGEGFWAPAESVTGIELPELLGLDEEAFRARFRRTPLWRPRREGLLRNALIVVGNLRVEAAASAARALLADPSPVLREAAGWCLGRLAPPGAAGWLREALAAEDEGWVRAAMLEDLARLESR